MYCMTATNIKLASVVSVLAVRVLVMKEISKEGLNQEMAINTGRSPSIIPKLHTSQQQK